MNGNSQINKKTECIDLREFQDYNKTKQKTITVGCNQ